MRVKLSTHLNWAGRDHGQGRIKIQQISPRKDKKKDSPGNIILIHVVTSWDLCTSTQYTHQNEAFDPDTHGETKFWHLLFRAWKQYLFQFQNHLSKEMKLHLLKFHQPKTSGEILIKFGHGTSGAAANKRRCHSLSLRRAAQVSSLPKVRGEAVTSGFFQKIWGWFLRYFLVLKPPTAESPYPTCQHLAENQNGLPESSSISTGLNKLIFFLLTNWQPVLKCILSGEIAIWAKSLRIHQPELFGPLIQLSFRVELPWVTKVTALDSDPFNHKDGGYESSSHWIFAVWKAWWVGCIYKKSIMKHFGALAPLHKMQRYHLFHSWLISWNSHNSSYDFIFAVITTAFFNGHRSVIYTYTHIYKYNGIYICEYIIYVYV